jgi:hypothetical protein
MRKAIDPLRTIGTVCLPKDLAQDVLDLLRDPVTKRTKYRSFNNLCLMLFSNWVEEQRLHPPPNTNLKDL